MARARGRIRGVGDDADDQIGLLDRLQNLIEENKHRIETAKEADDQEKGRDYLADYFDQLRMAAESQEELEQSAFYADGLATSAERAIVQAGKNALRNNPHQSGRLSEGEIAAIEGLNDPRLLDNQAALTAMNAARQQIRASLPVEIVGSEEYLKLVELTKPIRSTKGLDDNSFARQSGLEGNVRSEVRMGQIKRLIERIDEQVAADEVAALEAAGIEDEEELDRARYTYNDVVDMVTRKGRRGEEITETDVELVANHRLRLMNGLREYCPSWTPENPTRWISMGDRYVFDISLAAVPEDLVKETAAYEAMDLLRGNTLLTLRASTHTAEAVGRKSIETRAQTEHGDHSNSDRHRKTERRVATRLSSSGGTEWLA